MFSLKQTQAILTALPDPVFILTRSGKYAHILGGTDTRYYHNGSALIGHYFSEVLVAEKASWFMQQIALVLQSGQMLVVEYQLAGSDVLGLEDGPDEPIWFEGRIQPLAFQIDGEDAVLWVASNITARHQLQQRLQHLSEVDELSHLYNRRKLRSQLNSQFSLFHRHQTPCSLLVFDLDFFKQLNDTCGHPTGDCVIEAVGRVCLQTVREEDLAARYGGDEFAVLMPHTNTQQAWSLADRLRRKIQHVLLQMDLPQICTSISGGISEFLPSDEKVETIIQRADRGLYMAKNLGRNRICCEHPD
ncbi:MULTISPECIES: GGDEF domain-containing protein [Shewanella]|uniref:GGDEF domain-containing protein n=1 Tax=Shewanella TaxID=22 RepID=UPI001999B0E4|nr:sensor domain-containing diguanylate cyclase [Shewanella fodinae]MCL2907911.1 GGDEF domain-containing protein [Shewanella fodinae]GGZ11585.1 GGDEF domain-containing protein [Shewanella fodinae]